MRHKPVRADRGVRPYELTSTKTPPMPAGMRGEKKIAVPLSFVTHPTHDAGHSEGICIPHAPGRTFRAAVQGGLQPVAAPLLAKLWHVLFPIDAL